MAMIYNVAMLDNPASMAQNSVKAHVAALASLLRGHAWGVEHEPSGGPDLLIHKGSNRYAVELKVTSEGRADRVIPLLSQAILQARRHAASQPGAMPLALVQVDRLTNALREKVRTFHSEYAPEMAIGLVGEVGGRLFLGAGLNELNENAGSSVSRRKRPTREKSHDLFSDLHQWLLKVLLAPELPGHLLTAPRREFRTSKELADAAQTSAMSVSRFTRRLHEEGFLDESAPTLRLVRRAELFRRWQAAASRATPELPMRFLMPAPPQQQLQKVVATHPGACIGLFAAAGLLGSGHVADGLPWVYVRKLPMFPESEWPELVEAPPGEPLQLILKQTRSPEAVFRGAVQVQGAWVSDIIQVWLDVSLHPARGREQADFLARTVLADVLGGGA